jgi:membrane-associated phospholipid phosphatase
MDVAVLQWGLGLIRTIQSAASPALTIAMTVVTTLGSTPFYLAAIALVLWCFDSKLAVRLGIAFLLTAFLNEWLKFLFAQPRPFEMDASVKLADAENYGLPSAHAQLAVVFWGILAGRIRRPWGLVAAILVPLVIGFSRVYLGVHFPTDVLAGWAIGAVCLAAYAFSGERIAAFLSPRDTRFRLIIVAALALVMNVLHRQDVAIAGAFFGFGAGAANLESLGYEAGGSAMRKILRGLLGLAVLFLLLLGLEAVFPKAGQSQYSLFRFLRYGFVGVWGSYGAPFAFIKLGLAAGKPPADGTSESGE